MPKKKLITREDATSLVVHIVIHKMNDNKCKNYYGAFAVINEDKINSIELTIDETKDENLIKAIVKDAIKKKSQYVIFALAQPEDMSSDRKNIVLVSYNKKHEQVAMVSPYEIIDGVVTPVQKHTTKGFDSFLDE